MKGLNARMRGLIYEQGITSQAYQSRQIRQVFGGSTFPEKAILQSRKSNYTDKQDTLEIGTEMHLR